MNFQIFSLLSQSSDRTTKQILEVNQTREVKKKKNRAPASICKTTAKIQCLTPSLTLFLTESVLPQSTQNTISQFSCRASFCSVRNTDGKPCLTSMICRSIFVRPAVRQSLLSRILVLGDHAQRRRPKAHLQRHSNSFFMLVGLVIKAPEITHWLSFYCNELLETVSAHFFSPPHPGFACQWRCCAFADTALYFYLLFCQLRDTGGKMLESAASSKSSASPWCLVVVPGGHVKQRQLWAVVIGLKGNGQK